MYITTLDIRDIAQEWRDALEEAIESSDEFDDVYFAEFESLCNDLGIDVDPDSLEDFGDDEPTLIHESYFKEYAQDLADELGYMNGKDYWPFTCIDWDAAADELAMDYTTVTYEGDEYYIRSS